MFYDRIHTFRSNRPSSIAGIISQSPAVLTCVTIGYPKTFSSRSVTMVYRKISQELFWGFEEKKTRYNTYRMSANFAIPTRRYSSLARMIRALSRGSDELSVGGEFGAGFRCRWDGSLLSQRFVKRIGGELLSAEEVEQRIACVCCGFEGSSF